MIKKKIILASASPRRREILEQSGFSFEVCPSNFNEDTVVIEDPVEFVKTLAYKKAESVTRMRIKGDYILGADTSVVIEGKILGKPYTKEMTKKYLNMLSNKRHQVITGLSLIRLWDKKTITNYQITEVLMCSLSKEDIDFYTGTKEPFDKAGAYGIQGIGSRFVKEIHGDYFNVVGLPVHLLIDMLKEMGEDHGTISK